MIRIGLRLGGFLRPALSGSILVVMQTNAVKPPLPWNALRSTVGGGRRSVLGRLLFGLDKLGRLFLVGRHRWFSLP